ncbi:hypothetical protein PL426_02660 [Phocaeicola vulgatus]|jgi:hypothetical protein|nr:hypothetical protein [Phocaeicola vulgatus]MDB0774431.1 hypothetical protein [Phocaeicola vulgatus]
MGFTTPCFIRKNTEALREKLEEVGYKMLSPIEYDNLECSDNWVNDIKSLNDCNGFDCGTNEELFLAIAALRDDTDNNQLFTNGKGDWGIYRDGSDGGLSGMDFYGMPNDFNLSYYHKATVNELIEHFKTKEE